MVVVIVVVVVVVVVVVAAVVGVEASFPIVTLFSWIVFVVIFGEVFISTLFSLLLFAEVFISTWLALVEITLLVRNLVEDVVDCCVVGNDVVDASVFWVTWGVAVSFSVSLDAAGFLVFVLSFFFFFVGSFALESVAFVVSAFRLGPDVEVVVATVVTAPWTSGSAEATSFTGVTVAFAFTLVATTNAVVFSIELPVSIFIVVISVTLASCSGVCDAFDELVEGDLVEVVSLSSNPVFSSALVEVGVVVGTVAVDTTDVVDILGDGATDVDTVLGVALG